MSGGICRKETVFFIHMALKRVSSRLLKRLSAAVSVEAAIAIPVFLCCFLELLSLLNDLEAYGQVLYALKATGDAVSVYACMADSFTDGLDYEGAVLSDILFTKAYLEQKIRSESRDAAAYIQDGQQGISCLGSSIDWEQSDMLLKASYTVKPLFSIVQTELDMENVYYAKLWTGYDDGKQDEDETYVYIAENGSVYHRTDTCSYIRLSIHQASGQELESLRNTSGGRYSACELCIKAGEEYGSYFITDMGDRYHGSISCAGLKRTIHRIPLSEAGDYRPCSRCGGGEA